MGRLAIPTNRSGASRIISKIASFCIALTRGPGLSVEPVEVLGWGDRQRLYVDALEVHVGDPGHGVDELSGLGGPQLTVVAGALLGLELQPRVVFDPEERRGDLGRGRHLDVGVDVHGEIGRFGCGRRLPGRPQLLPPLRVIGGNTMHDALCTISMVRLVNFELDGERCLGVFDGENVVDLSDSGLPNDTIDLIAQWDRAKAEHAVGQGPRLPVAGVRLLAPIWCPARTSLRLAATIETTPGSSPIRDSMPPRSR